jgi:hypothetical protein
MALFIRSEQSQDFVQSVRQDGFSRRCFSLSAVDAAPTVLLDSLKKIEIGVRNYVMAVAFDCLGAAVVLRRSLLPARPLLNAPFCDARHFCTRNNPGIFQSPPVCGRYGRHVRRPELVPNDPQPRESSGLNHRRNNMTKFLTTFAVLAAFATPAFAQYAPQDYQPAAPSSVQHKSAARQNGLHAFAMVPRAPAGSSLDDPSLTGGGSTGYNELIRSY